MLNGRQDPGRDVCRSRGSGLDPGSITDPGQIAEFTLSGSAAAGVVVDAGAAVLVSGSTYRYAFSGAEGPVQVDFAAAAGRSTAQNVEPGEK